MLVMYGFLWMDAKTMIFRQKFFGAVVLSSVFVLMLGTSGCTRSTAAASDTRGLAAAQQRAMDQARLQMEQIPLPTKSRYLAVKSLTAWENPYLTVQGGMVTLHVVTADANTSDLGVGGMLRPMDARRQNLNVRVSELTAALNAVPETSWPYGRVVAVEEAHEVPASARPEVRRNMETVMKTLNDMGVVVYEWNDATAGK
jgi:hypothetical protein